ncbi:MAG: hypothetical protein ACLFP8_06050 [Alphaproteobacteria bacterium]
MSIKLQEFIELWKQERSLNALMKTDFSANDIEDLQKELLNLQGDEKTQAQDILTEVSELLAQRIRNLSEKMAETSRQMEQTNKTKQACLAYSRQEHMVSVPEDHRASRTEQKMARLQEREKQVRENLKAGKNRFTEKK